MGAGGPAGRVGCQPCFLGFGVRSVNKDQVGFMLALQAITVGCVVALVLIKLYETWRGK